MEAPSTLCLKKIELSSSLGTIIVGVRYISESRLFSSKVSWSGLRSPPILHLPYYGVFWSSNRSGAYLWWEMVSFRFHLQGDTALKYSALFSGEMSLGNLNGPLLREKKGSFNFLSNSSPFFLFLSSFLTCMYYQTVGSSRHWRGRYDWFTRQHSLCPPQRI